MGKSKIWNMGIRKFHKLFGKKPTVKMSVFGKPDLGESKGVKIQELAKEMNVKVIDIKLVEADPKNFVGIPILPVHPADREINVGDTVLMEYAVGVAETVIVDHIEDGVVYGTGDDGEPFSAPLDNCDKVPF